MEIRPRASADAAAKATAAKGAVARKPRPPLDAGSWRRRHSISVTWNTAASKALRHAASCCERASPAHVCRTNVAAGPPTQNRSNTNIACVWLPWVASCVTRRSRSPAAAHHRAAKSATDGLSPQGAPRSSHEVWRRCRNCRGSHLVGFTSSPIEASEPTSPEKIVAACTPMQQRKCQDRPHETARPSPAAGARGPRRRIAVLGGHPAERHTTRK